MLLLSRDSVLPSLNDVIVVPATRTIRGIETEVVLTEDDGMPTACALNFDHVSLARKERLGATIAHLDESRWPELVSATPAPWAFDFLEAIGKQVWKGLQLGAGHTIKTGALDGRPGTRETAVLVVCNALAPDSIATPNGRVELLLLLGVEDVLRQRVLAAYESNQTPSGWESSMVAELRNENPNLVTPIRSQGAWGVP